MVRVVGFVIGDVGYGDFRMREALGECAELWSVCWRYFEVVESRWLVILIGFASLRLFKLFGWVYSTCRLRRAFMCDGR